MTSSASSEAMEPTRESGKGVVPPGVKTPALIARELKSLRLPDLKGKTVLDIGAYDGFYSFAAERLGAGVSPLLTSSCGRSTCLGGFAYWRECKEKAIAPVPVEELPNGTLTNFPERRDSTPPTRRCAARSK